MGAANFYHITESPVEEVVRNLLSRAHAQGWRVEMRGRDAGRMDWFDQRLWGGGDSFLPHGRAGGPHDALQPILLTTAPGTEPVEAVLSVDGAEVTPEEIAARERVWILFDGHDQAALQHARTQWKALTAAGAQAAYWAEEGGRWEKKAESGPK
ncbi:DNA polymerase III subunit chi [Pseudothioclava nitratireducens]|uniref:DNA polymerase III subunit chi n=1 Tax=Pseudothioclava nitratireducens TaxID=1928646 RepID=UPI0023DA3DB1|nr:DNA polymerase III subunit chi [Defluviimonas nitratireducens]MDF1621328.1 DNA polymerase III subunit chi [Defluviimonas nitratireducens]